LAFCIAALTALHTAQARCGLSTDHHGCARCATVALASQGGIFAAARVELPGRFLWRAYRQMLARDAVPVESARDALPLTCRLMRHLPELAQAPGFEALAGLAAPR